MGIKKQEIPIQYRPSEQIKKLIEKYCPDKGGLSRTQLVDIAMRCLALHTDKEIDDIILRALTGRLEDKCYDSPETRELEDRAKKRGSG